MRKGESRMKKLILFGDSIMKGVTFNGSGYHLCPDHDLPQLAAVSYTHLFLDFIISQAGKAVNFVGKEIDSGGAMA